MDICEQESLVQFLTAACSEEAKAVFKAAWTGVLDSTQYMGTASNKYHTPGGPGLHRHTGMISGPSTKPPSAWAVTNCTPSRREAAAGQARWKGRHMGGERHQAGTAASSQSGSWSCMDIVHTHTCNLGPTLVTKEMAKDNHLFSFTHRGHICRRARRPCARQTPVTRVCHGGGHTSSHVPEGTRWLQDHDTKASVGTATAALG